MNEKKKISLEEFGVTNKNNNKNNTLLLTIIYYHCSSNLSVILKEYN